MRRSILWACLTLVLGLGLTAAVVTLAGLSTALAAGQADVVTGAHVYTTTHLTRFALFAEAQPDLTLEVNAPAHVAAGAEYAVRITYYNEGPVSPPNAWITATLPTGTQFIAATDRWGAPLPPTRTAGNTLTWYFVGLSCYKPLDANCGHILMTLATAQNLAEGTELPLLASISTTAVESDTTNNTASAVSIVSDMAGSAKQVHRGMVMPADVLTYTITLDLAPRPGSPQTAQERWVDLTDTLPLSRQARFLGWTSPMTGAYDGQMLQWQGRVRAGQPITLQYRLGVEGVVTPGTPLTNQAHLGWMSGTLQLGPVTTVVTLPHGALALGPYQNGELRHEYGVTLTVPPGAVTDTTRFQFRPLSNTDIISGPPGFMFAHRAFELTAFRFGQEVHQFARPLTITVNYSDTDVAGLKRETLRLWYRNSVGEPWAKLGEPARVMSGTHIYTTTHLTQFALFAEAAQRVFLPVVMR